MSSHPLVWLITGVNSGFGHDLSLIARKAGHTVIGTVRSLSKFPSSLKSAGVHSLELSLSGSEAQNNEAISKLVSEHGRIDVLVNNAGYGHLGYLEEVTDAELQKQLDVNVLAPVSLIRATLPHMRAAKSGVIVNVSSVAGVAGFAGAGVYNASKFALEGLSEALAQEVGQFGIRVHLVEPGYFRTNFLGVQGGGQNSGERHIAAYGKSAAELYGGYHDNQPGDPEKGMQRVFELVTGTGMCKGMEKLLRLPMGKDTIGFTEEKLKTFSENFEAMREIASSTDRDDVGR